MAHFEDLSPCTYFRGPSDIANPFVAVGWLEKDHPFRTGRVASDFFEKLVTLCVDPYEPWVFRGWHSSSLRQFPHHIETFRFKNLEVPGLFWRNLFVPDGTRIFATPVAILQYIDAHWYLPPDEFIAAVLACPPMKSMQYMKLFLESGGRPFVREESSRKPNKSPETNALPGQ